MQIAQEKTFTIKHPPFTNDDFLHEIGYFVPLLISQTINERPDASGQPFYFVVKKNRPSLFQTDVTIQLNVDSQLKRPAKPINQFHVIFGSDLSLKHRYQNIWQFLITQITYRTLVRSLFVMDPTDDETIINIYKRPRKLY